MAAIFKLKETKVGKKNIENEATILIDPKTNAEVNTVDEIKRISLQYCKDLLTKRKPRPGYEDIIKQMFEIHQACMEEYIQEEEMELSLGMFSSALERMKSKNTKKYSFILKGGPPLSSALFRFQQEWERNHPQPVRYCQVLRL